MDMEIYEEPEALWRSVICNKYGDNNLGLISYIANQKRFSSIWNNISRLLWCHGIYDDAFSSNIGFLLVNDNKIKF